MMYFYPEILVRETDITRVYVEVPVHYLESLEITNGTLIHLAVNQGENSLTLTAIKENDD